MTHPSRHNSHSEEPLLSTLASHVTLSDAEREEGKEHLRRFIADRTTPAVEYDDSPHTYRLTMGWRYTIAAICAGAVLGGSTLGASAYSLPGDTLYPMRVSVTEELPYLIAWTPESRAELNKERFARRMAEMVLIQSSSADNDSEDWDIISESFADVSSRVTEDIADLVENDQEITAAALADELASAADTYADHILQNGETAGSDNGLIVDQINTAGDLMQELSDALITTARSEPDTYTDTDETTDAVNDIQSDLDEVKGQIDVIPESEHAEASTTLSDAEQMVLDAKDSAANGDAEGAFEHLKDARDAIESIEAVIDLNVLSTEEVNFPEEVPTTTDTAGGKPPKDE